MLEIENNLNQIKAAQITEQERQRTMAQVFSSQFTKLNRDVTATKTVLNRIVEDAVNMQGKLRVLQGKVKPVRVVSSLSLDSIFSIIFSFLFKGIQSSTAYNDLISYVP